MDFLKISIDAQPQETQAYTVRLCDYANMFTLRNTWNTKIYMKMNIRGLNLLKMWNSMKKDKFNPLK